MISEIIVALLALIGTAIGSISGIIASNKTMSFRLQTAEERLDAVEDKAQEHALLIERIAVAEGQIKSAHQQINEIKAEIRRR